MRLKIGLMLILVLLFASPCLSCDSWGRSGYGGYNSGYYNSWSNNCEVYYSQPTWSDWCGGEVYYSEPRVIYRSNPVPKVRKIAPQPQQKDEQEDKIPAPSFDELPDGANIDFSDKVTRIDWIKVKKGSKLVFAPVINGFMPQFTNNTIRYSERIPFAKFTDVYKKQGFISYAPRNLQVVKN